MARNLREEIADEVHKIWAHWMRYVFSQCSLFEDEHGNLITVIPDASIDRWRIQLLTPYAELSEREKDSDREQADKILKILGEQ